MTDPITTFSNFLRVYMETPDDSDIEVRRGVFDDTSEPVLIVSIFCDGSEIAGVAVSIYAARLFALSMEQTMRAHPDKTHGFRNMILALRRGADLVEPLQ